MSNPLTRKLENFARLSADDRRALDRLATERVRVVERGREIIEEGENPRVMNLVIDGWACRHKSLEDGRRQILAFFLPGDICDLNVFILREMDHSLAALTEVTVAEVTREALEEVTLAHPRITQALWWETLVATSIQREWTLCLGQRDAQERLAHLLCELYVRMRAIGRTGADSCPFPLTQIALAEAAALSHVHVSRTLTALRQAGLVSLKGGRLSIPDLGALMRVGAFNTNYLHLEREGRHLDANE